MFSWLGDVFSGMGSALGGVFDGIGESVVGVIWDSLLKWFMTSLYNALSDVFAQIGSMGAEIFNLNWIASCVRLFFLLGWSLYAIGLVVSAFDLAIQYQSGHGNIHSTVLNCIKGFFAAGLVTTVPVELYKFSVSLQNVFLKDLTASFIGATEFNLGEAALKVLVTKYGGPDGVLVNGILPLVTLIGMSYCVLKVFFANIKRGGILLIQIAVGSLYLFSVPRGYTDGFNQWCKQVIALCLTAFLQTTLLFLGLLTFNDNVLLGLGIMLAAGEVPRVAQQFGLDSSIKLQDVYQQANKFVFSAQRWITRAM